MAMAVAPRLRAQRSPRRSQVGGSRNDDRTWWCEPRVHRVHPNLPQRSRDSGQTLSPFLRAQGVRKEVAWGTGSLQDTAGTAPWEGPAGSQPFSPPSFVLGKRMCFLCAHRPGCELSLLRQGKGPRAGGENVCLHARVAGEQKRCLDTLSHPRLHHTQQTGSSDQGSQHRPEATHRSRLNSHRT